MGYRIGSFNLKNLGMSAMGNENSRDLKKIAQIIREEEFDVVALQEVLSEGKAFTSPDYPKKCILMELGRDWDFEWANAETQLNDTRNEGYAFVWNTRRLRLATYETADGGKRTFYPRICRINKQYMQRRPYYARFTPADTPCGGPWAEFRLLCIHTYYGKDTAADRTIRNRELDVLIKDIYPQISDRKYGELGNGMPSYTVILGDYNVELWRPWKDIERIKLNNERLSQGKNPYPRPAFLVADENDEIESTQWGNRKIKTVQYEPTTLRASEDEQAESRGYAHDYDHFSYEEKQFEDVNMTVRRIDAVRKYCDDDFIKYFKTVSDHIPIMIDIELKKQI